MHDVLKALSSKGWLAALVVCLGLSVFAITSSELLWGSELTQCVSHSFGGPQLHAPDLTQDVDKEKPTSKFHASSLLNGTAGSSFKGASRLGMGMNIHLFKGRQPATRGEIHYQLAIRRIQCVYLLRDDFES